MRIGIVIPAFNAAGWIETCLHALVAQAHAGWVAVLVDDGSTDATGAIAGAIADPRVLITRQANAGVSAARNRGLAMLPATDALLFLDADDWLAPDALERLASALAAAPHAIAASGACGFVAEGAGPGTRPRRVKRPPPGDLLMPLLERNLFANGGQVLIRREAADLAGHFRTDLSFGEDWEYWTRIAAFGPFTAAPGSPVLFVRERGRGAYLRQATDPAAFLACTEAIFTNPTLAARLGPVRLAERRIRAEAEHQWVVGRALLRAARDREGRGYLRRYVA
ncbi:MAG: glycosyltransferase family 2 protein, partial [Acetobacteraceae bacterium]